MESDFKMPPIHSLTKKRANYLTNKELTPVKLINRDNSFSLPYKKV